MPSYHLRDYKLGDAAEMARIFYEAVRLLGPRRYSLAQVVAWAPAVPEAAGFERRAADGRLTIVAQSDEGRLLAFADLEADGHIDLFYRRPEAAGSGLAAELLDALVTRAVAQGIITLRVEASELARSLFERAGFTLIARRDFKLRGVPMHNYRLERTLP